MVTESNNLCGQFPFIVSTSYHIIKVIIRGKVSFQKLPQVVDQNIEVCCVRLFEVQRQCEREYSVAQRGSFASTYQVTVANTRF